MTTYKKLLYGVTGSTQGADVPLVQQAPELNWNDFLLETSRLRLRVKRIFAVFLFCVAAGCSVIFDEITAGNTNATM